LILTFNNSDRAVTFGLARAVFGLRPGRVIESYWNNDRDQALLLLNGHPPRGRRPQELECSLGVSRLSRGGGPGQLDVLVDGQPVFSKKSAG